MPFLGPDFLLYSEPARRLYHEYAAAMPIIDYHCHLPPDQLAQNRQFENLTQLWLAGDHYKWRALRANGVAEHFITGAATDWEKFEKWAQTVPYTLRNPLYHWTHLELQRYFGITELLTPGSARRIWEACNEQLQAPECSARGLLRRMQVEVVCTTDDPADSLEHHRALAAADPAGPRMLPTFRPDKALAVEDPATYNAYLDRLAAAAGLDIRTYQDLEAALRNRHDYFAHLGGRLSDHGLSHLYADDYTPEQVTAAFAKVRGGAALSLAETGQFKSGLLVFLGRLNWEKGWTQQFHVGALRNNSTRLLRRVGPDAGGDSIGDYRQGLALARYLDRLDAPDQLAKTILYNLNPADNDLMATMAGNFQDGSVPGKIQFGSGWWFLDQKQGIEQQLNSLSSQGLLSRFVGMLTDSRSFLSFPRHEYFRRILCNLLGEDVRRGELPADLPALGQLVQNVCYHNAHQYFGFGTPAPTAPVSPATATHV
ncbi:glucuronate isomerase [Hymenobacter psychrophilus]|uniref:Uronate isomerase n=1 Tax=Hymenobacter psychrophilus TaxID=651662 RepID=A0A1H3CIT3_9BACT|nr:glucuronate isomerase [Hymenobacter psychrophilus]SDX54047.1 glucuronate isomerase [Hymenobacter psychrophilus]